MVETTLSCEAPASDTSSLREWRDANTELCREGNSTICSFIASSELLDGGGSKQSEMRVGALCSGVFLGGQSSVDKNVPLVAVNRL